MALVRTNLISLFMID